MLMFNGDVATYKTPVCLMPLRLYELQAICLMMSEGIDELQTQGRPFEEDTRNESVFTFGSVRSKPSAETLFETS